MGAPVTDEVLALRSPSGGRGVRRRWSVDEKLAIVRESEVSGDPVAVVARRHGMNANHLFIWRQKARAGTLGRDLRRKRPAEGAAEPVRFIDLGVVGQGGPAPRGAAIEIELPSGVIVRAPPGTTSGALRAALMAVKAVL